MRCAWTVALTLVAALPAAAGADVPEVASFHSLPAADAPAFVSHLVPKGAKLVSARSGELLRLSADAGHRPTVGRLWRRDDSFAAIDESDLLTRDGKAWRYTVPLGAHESVFVAGATRIERAERRDIGYGWEIYEDALVDWGDSASTAPPPAAPAAAAARAFREAAAASALLGLAGDLSRGGRSLRVALALEAVSVARPLVGPFYRPESDPRVVDVQPGTEATIIVRGPVFVRVTAADASTRVARIPPGLHPLAIPTAGLNTVETFRKREQLADVLSGDESVQGRAAKLLSSPSRLVAAEARRLTGDVDGARRAFAALESHPTLAVRAYASWRALTLGDEGARARVLAAAALLPAATRATLLAALPAPPRDVPELVAAIGAAPLGDARALRRAFFDRTMWVAGAPGGDTLVLVPGGDACVKMDGYRGLDSSPLTVVVPPDPLGAGRYLAARVAVFTEHPPALDAELLVDGTAVPVPARGASDMQRVALAPGTHQLTARGGAQLFVQLPGDLEGARQECGRRRLRPRNFTTVSEKGTRWPIAAPGGALLGLELRLRQTDRRAVEATLSVDGAERRVRFSGDDVIVDFVARDPSTVSLRAAGRWLARPLLRVTREEAAARIALDPATAPPAPPSTGGDLRRLSSALAAEKRPEERARLLRQRAFALAALGRVSYAEEDLRRAGEDRLLEATRSYVAADPARPAYALDAASYSLSTAPQDQDDVRHRLAAAEADRLLDELAVASPLPEGATRAYVAASRGGTAPGASDALARASDATRWRAVAHADSAPGSLRAARAPRTVDAVRAALIAPDLDPNDAVWIDAGQTARAELDSGAAPELDVRCAELRPAAAAERPASGDACRIAVRLDGTPVRPPLPALTPGAHSLEIELAPGGLDVHAAVRLSAGGRRVALRTDETRLLAIAGEPARFAVLGPTVLRVDADAPVHIRDGDQLLATTTAEVGRAEVILDEARPYHITVEPPAGRAAFAAAVREDRARPTAAVSLASLHREPPQASSPPPVVPATSLRLVDDAGDLGTITASEELRDGHVGDREDDVDLGGAYAQTAVAYRRRSGDDIFWRAGVLGRVRLEGGPSGGFDARALWLGDDLIDGLRASADVMVLTQNSDSGTLATGWLDLGVYLRRSLGHDLFLTPSLGVLVREGPVFPPGGAGLDPDVWSSYDAERPHRPWAELRLDAEPALDLHLRARLRAVGDELEADRAGALVGISGAVQRLTYGGSFELEERFPTVQPIVRLGVGFSLWRGARDRLALYAGTSLRPGERTGAFAGVSYDWTFGRGLADYAPDEHEYAAQIGPWESP